MVGFDMPVRLAHAMEDCLVRAQEGKLTLTGGGIDNLLAGVDLLVQIAAAAGPGLVAWEAEHGGVVESLRIRLESLARGEDAPPAVAVPLPAPPRSPKAEPAAGAPSPSAPTASPAPPVPRTPHPRADVESHERVVRVTAQNLSRLMGLAGESLVEARWLQPFSDSLQHLKIQQAHLGDELDELLQLFPADARSQRGRELVAEIRRRLVECDRLLADRIVAFENHARRSMT